MKTIGLISANYISGEFGEITDRRTLASIPYGGRYRLIDFALSNMANAGISTVGVISPYNSGSLIDHIGKGKPWGFGSKVGGIFILPGSVYGVSISGNRFLLRDFIANRQYFERDDADYILISGSSDVYNMDYRPLIEHHHEIGSPITVVYRKMEESTGYRGFFVDTNETGFVTKMVTKSTGPCKYFMDCFVIDRKYLLDFIEWFAPLEYMDIMDIVSENLNSIEVNTFEFDGYLGKVSNINDYMRVSKDFLNKEVRKEIFNEDRNIYTKVQDEAPVHFTNTANVKNSIVSAGCIIEGQVENSIIFRSTHIGKGAEIKDSIIMQHGEIGEDVELANVICDKYVEITEGTKISGDRDPIIIGRDKKL
ncbi:MAG: glucose-1-phosphate adenylyltransferase subunit GlgD [Firmicutes bacterium]|nr:glucose-1-phosphate adenylyltransferase subunit GlgD [Bacillota bacterium]